MKEYINGSHKLTLDFNLNIVLVFKKEGDIEKSDWNDYLQIFIDSTKIFSACSMDGGNMWQLYNEISKDLLKQKR